MSPEIAVIGAGPSGLGAAIRLRQAGLTDFVVLERAAALGGTWRDNTYPGCACDVPSALYSFSFAPNPEWSRAFAPQPEILRYLEQTAARHGVTTHLRLGTDVEEARWSAAEHRWHLRTSRGPVRARFLIAAAGPWHAPRVPALPGLGTFPGVHFHSARWDHGRDLRGRRVAVIGSGASAVQLVPEIAPVVRELHLFQRTAQWVLPKPDHAAPWLERQLWARWPRGQRWLRAAQYQALEALGVGFRDPRWLRALQRVGTLHLAAAVRDPAVRAKVTPDHTLGCKRILLSNRYYPALGAPNVRVHATGVEHVDGAVVVGADGARAEVDTIIFATGFHILDMPVADRLLDAEGLSMAARWRGSPRAYLGTTVAGFPNLFLLLGPSLGTGHSSAFSILEAQLELTLAAITHARDEGAALEVHRDVVAAFNADVQAALAGTVYNTGGCSSYYLDANGVNSFAWPWSTDRLRARVAHFDPGAYVLRADPAEVLA